MRTVIVGAGAAGAVIASRLTESEAHEVLLLEAGPDHGADIPADLADGTRNSMVDHDWGLSHWPTPFLPNFPMPRGKVVGGSSAVNTCIALRGQPADYDEWASMGAKGWGWEQVLPFFKKLERDLDFGATEIHGGSGPLPVRRHTTPELTPWQAAFEQAWQDMGQPVCPDTNAPDATGVGRHAMNKIDGRRISAAEAWLTPAVRARPNLQIRDHTHVVRIRFEGQRATAVEVERHGQPEVHEADRVVLCGGAFGTPAILLRSGIGPRAELRRLAVDEVRDAPHVGAKLLDHPGCALFFRPTDACPWQESDPLIQTVCLFDTSDASAHRNTLQFQAGSCIPTKWGGIRGVSVMLQLTKPKGHGRMWLPNADPHAKPVIRSDFFQHPDDHALAVKGLGMLDALTRTPAMKDLATGLYPGRFLSGREWLVRRWVRLACDSGYHPCGTVPMGKAVDHQGRFDGIDNLHVADVSLFPTVPSSNTHLPTLMVGEKLSAALL